MSKGPDRKAFNAYFADGLENLTKTAFPTLGKVIYFSSTGKVKDERSASDTVSSSQNDLGTPNRRSSQNAILTEQVVDGLIALDERLKTQGIVLASSLEQQTTTNQLLSRLTGSPNGLGGAGGSIAPPNGGGSGGLLDDVLGAIGLGSIGNFIKSGGSKLLGGAAALITPEVAIPAAVAAAGYGAYKATEMDPTAATDAAAAEAGLDPNNRAGSADMHGFPIQPHCMTDF